MQGMTLSWLAERNAYKFPEKEAVVMQPLDGERATITNATLNDRVNRIANGLRERGIEQDDAVAIYTANSLPTIEVYLGTMRIGALPVPVNHRFQAKEVQYVLEDSDTELLIFDDHTADIVDSVHDAEVTPNDYLHIGPQSPVYADDYAEFRESAVSRQVEIVPSRLDVAMLMYTSGTTGKPKGCLLTHDNLLQRTVNRIVEKGLRGQQVAAEGRGIIVTPLFHIAAFGKFIDNQYASATTVLTDGFDAEGVLEILDAESITTGFFVPTMARAMLAVEDFDDYDLSAFTEFGIGAAPSGKELKETISDAFDADIREAFGQTEMSPTTTVLMGDEAIDHPDSVGRPVLNVLTRVIDPKTGETVEPGEIGRICYRGPTMFQGYHNMPDRTEAAFEDGFFVSGDLVTRDEDGFIEFVGRYDDMIITGGENVYPTEIEETLNEHPDVDEAAVVGVPDERWGERIRAVVVPTDEAPADDDLREYVGDRLADYKKPKEFVFLDALPRNPSGKILRAPLEDTDRPLTNERT